MLTSLNYNGKTDYQQGTRKKIQNYSYGLNDKIGKGYSSTVYRGKNDDTNEVVAIKVIDMKGVKDEVGKQMLECEIEALKTLKHPNILKCFDVFTTVNNCYIITEYCNEGDLASLISKRRKLSEQETLKFLKQISSGLVEIASNNFLHRDLKLANIFLANGVAKIADFGFAKKNKNPQQREKYNVGSPLYMSPEALKKNIYSVKNDIWSVGVIIYELLHGQTPWESKTEKQLMDKMVRIPVNFVVKISEELKDFIRKCLEVNQIKRMGLSELISHPLIKRLNNQVQPRESLPSLNSATFLPESLPVESAIVRVQNKRANDNKQNTSPINNPLAKPIVERNNNILVHHINIFRLLFKILDQIKLNRPEERKLIQLLSNQILSKVNYMKTLTTSVSSQKVYEPLELKQFQKYIHQSTNPAIKKYKVVILQYHKKYNTELKREQSYDGANQNIENRLREFVKSHDPTDKQALVFHWIVEFLSLPKDIRKDYLENIIEPKAKPTLETVLPRLRLL